MSTSLVNEGASRTQFGLKSLLLFVTANAAVLVPTYWFGSGFLIPFLFSTLLFGLCVRGYSNESRGPAIGVAVLGLIVGFLFAIASMVFFVHTFWNAIICVALAATHARPKAFAATLGAVMLVVYGFAICKGAGELAEVRSAKARYPLESLESRLAFQKVGEADRIASQNTITLTTAVANHLDEQDERQQGGRYDRRQWALEQLHEKTYRDFVFAPGFGVSRMPRFRPQMVELEPFPQLTLPRAVNIASSNASPTELYGVHRAAIGDFLSPNRIGYVRSRTDVAGFNAHVLTDLDEWSNNRETNQKWQVVRLELVSLLRHSEPRVYVAATMPAMDQLATVPHRALDEFEKGALPSLESRQDVVVDKQVAKIDMLGAVRAGTTCLECHDVQRGRLLGAFSYEMTPLVAAERTTASMK